MPMTSVSGANFTIQHQRRWKDFLSRNQKQIRRRREGNSYFHELVNGLIRAQVAPDSVIVDFGCSDGKTLEACQPRGGVGIDIDEDALEIAKANIEHYELSDKVKVINTARLIYILKI